MRFSVPALASISFAMMASAADPQMPALTGKHSVGTTSVKMTDNSRNDQFAPQKEKRSILVQFYYPTKAKCGCDNGITIAPYGPKKAIDYFAKNVFGFPDAIAVEWAKIKTSCLQNAPIDTTSNDKYPFVVFSPGYGSSHMIYQSMIHELASHGYIVAAMTHTYEAPITVFPDGEAIEHAESLPIISPAGNATFTTLPAIVRTQDARFIMDSLSSKIGTRYIPGLKKPLDVRKCGMFGHSLGGATTANVMANDKRVVAGVNLDGAFQVGTDYLRDLKRPFAMWYAENHDAAMQPNGDETHAPFFKLQTGYTRQLNLTGAVHTTFSDAPMSVTAMGLDKVLPKEAVTALTGTVDPKKAIEIIPKYVVDFFDHTLKGKGQGVLGGKNSKYPEVIFMK